MAIVIRTAYNNNGWKAPCDTPGKDPLCFYCFKGLLGINEPNPSDIVCSGNCWEQHLGNDYKWGCPPKGKVFGQRAYPGAAVFLVFKQPDDNYTIWGKTVISSVDIAPMRSDSDFEDGFAFIHFDPFEPLPVDKWVGNIPYKQLVGKKWMQGRHRYIDANRENYLNRLIDGEAVLEVPNLTAVKTGTGNGDGVVLGTTVTKSIYKRLEEIATAEGRTIDELVREAVAVWIRSR